MLARRLVDADLIVAGREPLLSAEQTAYEGGEAARADVVKASSEVAALTRTLASVDLAKRVGVSRQTIYAIDAGTYEPNTAVPLKLARELEVSVEKMFALSDQPEQPAHTVTGSLLWSTVPFRAALFVCHKYNTLGFVPPPRPRLIPFERQMGFLCAPRPDTRLSR